MSRVLFAACVAAGLAACTKAPSPNLPIVPPPTPPTVKVTPGPSMNVEHPAVPGLAVSSAKPRRLSVLQVERSLEAIGKLPIGSVRFPPSLSLALGRPDWRQVTQENLEPNPLFMKTLLDVGGLYCSNLAQAEPTRPVADKLLTSKSTVDENVAELVLRFTGLEGEVAVPLKARLRKAYDSASVSTAPLAGYQAVCVALTVSPEFLLY